MFKPRDLLSLSACLSSPAPTPSPAPKPVESTVAVQISPEEHAEGSEEEEIPPEEK